MVSSNRYSRDFRNILIIAVCFVLSALSSAQAQAPGDDRLWTTVGSAGTVDEADVNKVFFDHSVVQMGSSITTHPAKTTAGSSAKSAVLQSESAVIRYNVTPVDGLFAPPVGAPSSRGVQLRLRYLNAGPRAQVVAKLIEVDLATGSETVRLTFNSNSFPAANGYQVQEAGDCGPLWRFDFKLSLKRGLDAKHVKAES